MHSRVFVRLDSSGPFFVSFWKELGGSSFNDIYYLTTGWTYIECIRVFYPYQRVLCFLLRPGDMYKGQFENQNRHRSLLLFGSKWLPLKCYLPLSLRVIALHKQLGRLMSNFSQLHQIRQTGPVNRSRTRPPRWWCKQSKHVPDRTGPNAADPLRLSLSLLFPQSFLLPPSSTFWLSILLSWKPRSITLENTLILSISLIERGRSPVTPQPSTRSYRDFSSDRKLPALPTRHPQVFRMSANLDKSLDDLVGSRRQNARRRSNNRRAAAKPSVGGVKKSKPTKAAPKAAHPAPKAAPAVSSKIIVSGLVSTFHSRPQSY